jgi:hypothetical protein
MYFPEFIGRVRKILFVVPKPPLIMARLGGVRGLIALAGKEPLKGAHLTNEESPPTGATVEGPSLLNQGKAAAEAAMRRISTRRP